MAFTIDQYNTLVAAISQGARRVKYADKEVEYETLDNMLAVMRLMENELQLNGATGRIKTSFASFSKGLNGCNNRFDGKWQC